MNTNEQTKNHEELTQDVTNAVEDLIQEEQDPKEEANASVKVLNDGQILVEDHLYGIVYNYRDGFDAKELSKRYSDVLARYDYIVGDWGFEQLRLKGFFDNDNKKAMPDQKIATLQDYLYEYCNFGCRYFVIEKVNKKREKPTTNKKRRKPRRQEAHVEEEIKPIKKGKPVIHRKKREEKAPNFSKQVPKEKSGSFNIRKRED